MLLFILSIILALISLLPIVSSPHWVFRAAGFVKIQLFVSAALILAVGFLFRLDLYVLWAQTIAAGVILYQSYFLFLYTPLFPSKYKIPQKAGANSLHFISSNVYQFSEKYKDFIAVIYQERPDFFLTMESNSAWQNALYEIHQLYPHRHSCTLENTYGMHFYSKIPIESATTHFFVADDIPNFEIHLKSPE